MRRLLLFLSVFFVASLTVAPAHAQTASVAPDAAPAQAVAFGHALAMDGDHLFVGDPTSVHAPGRVLVYRKTDDGWTESARLESNDAAVGDGFGGSLAIDGERLVVGAPASGAAYVFEQGEDGWTQTARLAPSGDVNGQFAAAVTIRGDVIAAGIGNPPFTFDPRRGSVVLFANGADGWTEAQTLAPDDLRPGDGFGESLALTGDHLFVGAPRSDRMSGVVHVFEPSDNGTWVRLQTLDGVDGHFGSALHASEGELVVGAPRADARRGAVQMARLDGDTWAVAETLLPFDAPSGALFGTSVARTGAAVWAGAPGAASSTGTLYGFTHDGDRWTQATRETSPGAAPGTRLGSVVVASGSSVAAGQPGEDYGARMSGGSRVATFDAEAQAWGAAPLTPPSRGIFTSVTGEKTPCSDGEASLFDCNDVDLLSFLPIDAIGGSEGVRVNDVWGWTDPETGRDYALVGRVDGTAFVDVTEPTNPVFIGELPKTEGSEAKIWRDVKVYQNYAFVVADNAGVHGMQVFDLTKLRAVEADARPATFEADAMYEGIHSAHNVFINEDTGFAYVVGSNGGGQTCGGGLHMVDVRDPLAPTFVGCFADPSTGRTGTGATHDTQCIVYDGPDADYQGQEICFSSNETAVSIADVTDKANPMPISTAAHPKSAYVHQGWLTDDRRYFYVNDELDEISGLVDRTRTLVWDVSDLDDPQLVKEFFLSTPASDHNLYVRGTTMYQSNYTSGLRIVDVSDPANPKEVGHFDTLPFGADAPGFEGSFSNYPFFESGIVVVTSIQEGLFVVKKSETEL